MNELNIAQVSVISLSALVLATVGLVVACVAYWRSGGQQDVSRLRHELGREIEALKVRQRELVESARRAIGAAYDANRVRLIHAGQRLDHLKDEAVGGLEAQIEAASKQLQSLQTQLAESLKAAMESTISAAEAAEQAIARRVHRLEARTTLLQAKSKIQRAVRRADDEQFELAERRLEEAAELLRSVRRTLGSDHAYDEALDGVKQALREATAAVRSKAEDVRRRIEHVLHETDSLVAGLETDESQESAKRAA